MLPTSYILINSDLGTDESIIEKIKGILAGESSIQYEIQGVYGVYDIVLKLSSDDIDTLRSTITNKIRKNHFRPINTYHDGYRRTRIIASQLK